MIMQFANKVFCVLKAENFRSEVNNIEKQFVKIIEITHKILKSILYQVIGLKTHKERNECIFGAVFIFQSHQGATH